MGERTAVAGPPGDDGAAWAVVLERSALLGVLVLTALLALRQVDSLDVGFHLRAGNHVLDGNGWPRTDPFSFTMRDHAYVDTSWGYQVLIAAVERSCGPAGLVLLHAGLVLATGILLWRTARLGAREEGSRAASGPRLLPLLLILGALGAEMRFSVRPEVLSYLFLAGVLHLLQRHASGLRAPLWLLPVLFLAWANCHSLFVLGWAALACFLLGSFLESRQIDGRLLSWSLAGVAIALLNPYGLRGVLFPLTLLTRFRSSNPFSQEIGEFVSPFDTTALDAQPFFPVVPVFAFRAFAVLAVLALVVLARRRSWTRVLLILVFAWPAVRMIRNTPVLVVAALPAISWAFSGVRLPAFRRIADATNGLVIALAVVLALRVRTDAYYLDSRRQERSGLALNASVLPVETVEYARRAQLAGPPLNHLNFGGWLMWAGSWPVFIDGRLEVVGEEFYGRYRQALSSQEELEACVARWGIRWMLFPYANFPRLLGRMSADPRWVLVHADPVGAIFVRAGPAAPRLVDPELARVLAPGPPVLEALPGFPGGPARPGRVARWTAGLLERQRFPAREHYLGLFHLYRGEHQASAARFAGAIRESEGRYYELYSNLGAALYRLQRWEEAALCYRAVLEERPEDPLARQRASELERRVAR